MATGCVKIVKKSSEFDATGKFIPKEKRSQSVDLFKGNVFSDVFFLRKSSKQLISSESGKVLFFLFLI